MFKVVNSALFYYYFNAVVFVLYPFILVKSIFTNRSPSESLKTFFILMIPMIIFFGVLCLKYNIIFSAYLLLFYFGGYFFYIYFNENNLEISINSLLIFLCLLTIFEAIAINTIISPSDLPNWPLSVEDTILHGESSRGGLQLDNFYYIRPIGFGGNSSITASLLMTFLFYLSNNGEDTFFNNLVSLAAIIFLYSGLGFILFSLYLVFKMRALVVSIFLLIIILISAELSDIQKLDLEYYQFIINDIFNNILWVIHSISISEFIFGQVIPFEAPIGGDFYWLYFFQWFGSIGLIFYFFLIALNVSKINFIPIMILVISTLHYHTLFSIPGQMLFGYLLTRKNFSTKNLI